MADIWNIHSDLIKRLYQSDRKTLKDVKEILEAYHGFPQHPLSTYETKLRDVLKLRKKLRREDWEKIHFYTLSRGYKKRQYDVYLNGTPIPWEKVWKEVRRSGALRSKPVEPCDINLPQDVVVVPRAGIVIDSGIDSPTIQDGHSSLAVVATRADRGAQSQLQPAATLTPATEALMTAPRHDEKLSRQNVNYALVTHVELAHEALPWNKFRQTLLVHASNGQAAIYSTVVNGSVMSLMPQDGFFPDMHEMVLALVADTMYPSMWNLYDRLPLSKMGSSRQFWLRHLSMLTYILSNGINGELDGPKLFDLLGMVITQLPAKVITNAFLNGGLSLRALWDSFVSQVLLEIWFQIEANKEAKLSLNAIGQIIDLVWGIYPGWIEDYKDELLCLTSFLGRTDLVRNLLKIKACISIYHDWEGWNAISAAAMSGVLDCSKALIASFNMNGLCERRKYALSLDVCSSAKRAPAYDSARTSTVRDLVPRPSIEAPFRSPSHFATVLLHSWPWPSERDSNTRSTFIETLQLLIKAGADVFSVYPLNLSAQWQVYHREIPLAWHPTCLDMAFYHCKDCYLMMQSNVSSPSYILSRGQLCTAIQSGSAELSQYLDFHSLSSPSDDRDLFLEMLLLEQFFIRQHPRGADLNWEGASIARRLLEYGVVIRHVISDELSSFLLSAWVASVDEYGLSEDLDVILRHLSNAPLAITAEILTRGIEHRGIQILEALQNRGLLGREVVALLGAEALMQAVRLENNDAVSWLLQNGVDVNAQYGQTTAISHCLTNGSLTVCEHLVEAGAKLRHNLSDRNCYELVRSGVLFSNSNSLDTFRFLLTFDSEIHTITSDQWNDLLWSVLEQSHEWELCNWRERYGELFDYLFFHFGEHFNLEAGPILAVAIRAPASPALIQAILDRGTELSRDDEVWGSPICAAIEMRQFDLVRQLLGLGADIHIPVKHRQGNALSKVCDLSVSCMSEKLEKKAFLQFLIDIGADVNGGDRASASWVPFTPLQVCAVAGDVEVASMLLQHQADPNLIRLEKRKDGHLVTPSTALDLAVEAKRLDMTQLLLKSGALSHEPGLSGYEGCVKLANSHGGGAIAELISQHVMFVERESQNSLVFRRRHQAMVEQVWAAERDLREVANLENRKTGCRLCRLDESCSSFV